MILLDSSKVIMSLMSLASVTLIKLITVKDGQVISLIRLSWEISLKGF